MFVVVAAAAVVASVAHARTTPDARRAWIGIPDDFWTNPDRSETYFFRRIPSMRRRSDRWHQPCAIGRAIRAVNFPPHVEGRLCTAKGVPLRPTRPVVHVDRDYGAL